MLIKYLTVSEGVDLDIIWDIITVDIPSLRKKLKRIMKKEGWET